VFSPAEAIEVAADRYRMTARLARAGLPIPRTAVTEAVSEAIAVVHTFRHAILKPIYTSTARGMHLLSAEDPLTVHLLESRANEGLLPLYLQEFVPGVGRDVAVAVLGGRILGAYARIAPPGEWITSTSRGGRYAACDLAPRTADLGQQAAALFGLDYTVVDLVEAPDGRTLIYEVSAFGGFRGLLEARGIDAADAYAEHLLNAVRPARAAARA
jgi:ribosomal protein S6--L-glutamate ligase